MLYTAAEGNGGLGAVLVSPSSSLWFGCPTPSSIISSLLPRKIQIYALEVLAAAAALRLWAHLLHDRHVLAFIDNTAALATLQKGSSRAHDVHGLVSNVWDRLSGSLEVASIAFY